MALTSKLPMNMLLGANGEGYAPNGGISGSIWGTQNVQRARQNEGEERIANMGRPGMAGAGFLNTSKYGLPNSTWDGYHGLMMGLRDAAMQRGQNFKVNAGPGMPSILGPSNDTRFDGDQVGLSGHTLTDDTYGNREDLKIPVQELRRRFGL